VGQGGHGVPVRRFGKGENKGADGKSGRRRAGGATRDCAGKNPDRRSWKATGQEHVAPPHMEWARQMGFVNHFYFSLWTRTEAGRFGRPSPTPVAGVSG